MLGIGPTSAHLIADAITISAESICKEMRRIDTALRHSFRLPIMTREEVLKNRLDASRAERRRLKECFRILRLAIRDHRRKKTSPLTPFVSLPQSGTDLMLWKTLDDLESGHLTTQKR